MMKREYIAHYLGKPIYADELYKFSEGWCSKQYEYSENTEKTNNRIMWEISQNASNIPEPVYDRALMVFKPELLEK